MSTENQTTQNPQTEEEAAEKEVEEAVQQEVPEEDADCVPSGEETADEEKETAGEEKETAGKKFFSKKKDKAFEKLEERVAELEDARMRQLAEFENFRKRSEKEKSQMFEIGAKSVVEKVLPVIDNFERGLAGVSEEEKGTPFLEGIEMVYKQMLSALEEIGVTPIEAVGTEFNPDYHNAVMMVDSEELESGTVAEELQKGYLYHDSVVRHSMVKVVN